jgi:outer membrane lipoprotein
MKFRNASRSYLKNRILAQGQGGTEFQSAGILKYVEELERGPNTEIGRKDLFEMASNILVLAIFSTFLLMSCTAGISQQARSKVTYTGAFSALQKTPDAYKGEVVMLGGRIIEAKASYPLSELTVLQLDIGTSDRPKNSDKSEGRFIVQSKQLLDPAIYEKDKLITVVGTLKGSKVLPIGDLKYTDPIVEPIEIKLWPKGMQTQPVIHFGIGVGTTF